MHLMRTVLENSHATVVKTGEVSGSQTCDTKWCTLTND